MKETAILVIDLQNGMLDDEEAVFRKDDLIRNVKMILDAARKRKYPVIMIQHSGKKGDTLEPGTKGWAIYDTFLSKDSETVIHKNYPDAFYETDLDMVLKSEGIKNLIICGMQSELCVDSTCRDAFVHGYKITLASDGHSTYDRKNIRAEQIVELENSVLGEWFGTVDTSEHLASLLDGKKLP